MVCLFSRRRRQSKQAVLSSTMFFFSGRGRHTCFAFVSCARGLYIWTADIEGKDKFYLSSSHDEQSESYWLLNTNLAYSADQWSLSVWGRNLTDEDVIVRGFGGFGNDPRKYYATEPYYQLGEPRTFGVSGQYNF